VYDCSRSSMAPLPLPRSLPETFSYAQARSAGLSKRALYRLRDSGRIEPLARGLYRRNDAEPADTDLLEFALRAPLATLCLTTALARHGLSDAIPSEIDLALPRGTRAPATRAPARWHRFDPATFKLGRETLRVDHHHALGLYSAERSIIDAFRMRGHEGQELAHEALKRWLRRKGSQPSRLLKLAAHFPRTAGTIRKALEILL